MKTYTVQFWNYGTIDVTEYNNSGNRIGRPITVQARDHVEAAARAACLLDLSTNALPLHLGIRYIEEGTPITVYGSKP